LQTARPSAKDEDEMLGSIVRFVAVPLATKIAVELKDVAFPPPRSSEQKLRDARAKVIKLDGQLAKARLDNRSAQKIRELERELAKAQIDANTSEQLVRNRRGSSPGT
jgi:hypothetical protein